MKRMWIGAALLAVLLAAGLLAGSALEARFSPAAQALRQAGEWAAAEDWDRAAALSDEVRADWEKAQWLAQALTGHETLEQIQTSFAQLEVYKGSDVTAFSALCAALAQELEALGDAHRCSWENFF